MTVALAAITVGFRTALLHPRQQLRVDSLRTLASMSGRSSPEGEKLPYLPINREDPVQRLQTMHSRLTAAQNKAIHHLPIALRAHAIQLLNRLQKPGIATLTINAPGPRRSVTTDGPVDGARTDDPARPH